MWKRGGRSSALDRAQALLSARRSSRGDAESVQGSGAPTGALGLGVKTRSSSPTALLSDLSDLSSVSSGPEHGAETFGSAAAAAAAAAGKSLGREGHSTKNLRPQSSMGRGGSRFLKKAPLSAPNSSQSPIRKVPEHRNVSFSQQGSQTAALSRLAQIESRSRSRKQVQAQTPLVLEPDEIRSSVMGISPPPASQSSKDHLQLSAQSSSDQSLKGKRFLKIKTAEAVDRSSTAAARSPKSTDVGVRSRSRAADAFVPSVGLEMKSGRVMNGVSLESDEEDMRKLLGDSLDSMDNSLLIPGRSSSSRTANKMVSKSIQQMKPSPPPAAAPLSSSYTTIAPPHSPASPSRNGSPFRYTGQAQAHYSPSVLSPSPYPPRVSPSSPGRLSSPQRVGSPQRAISSMSGCGEVLSLEELFSVGPGSEDTHSEMSAVSSEDFKINVMTLDDLAPATLGITEETPRKERHVKHSAPLSGSPDQHRHRPGLKEEEKKEEQQQEDMVDYQSDFESESGTEPDYSVSQVSEHLLGDGGEEEGVSEVRDEALDSDVSQGRTQDDYLRTSHSSDPSCTFSRYSRSSGSSTSDDSRTLSCQSRRRASRREAGVQTQPDLLASTWPSGMTSLGPQVDLNYMNPSPVVAHTLSAEMVEALSSFNPAVFALNEMLKQQLAMTRRFIESSRHLHSSLVHSLGPPDYRYTTLEDTEEYIRKHRPPKLTMEEALEEVQREMRGFHHV